MDARYLSEVLDSVKAYAKGFTDGAKTALDAVAAKLQEEKKRDETIVEVDKVPTKTSKQRGHRKSS